MKGTCSVPSTAARLVMRNIAVRGGRQQARPPAFVALLLGRLPAVASSTPAPSSSRSLWSNSAAVNTISLQQQHVQSLFTSAPFELHSRCFSDKTPPNEQEAERQEQEEEAKTEQDAEAPPPPPPPPTVSREEELDKRVKALDDLHKRALAEQENIRRIAARDVEASRHFAIKSFAKSLLDTSDNLSRALEAVPEDKRHNDKTTKNMGGEDEVDDCRAILANLYEGIEMTQRELNKAFSMNGLHKYGEIGEVFDPNKHQALFEYVDAEKTAGTVGQIMKPGFMLRDRVLRPAEVGVVKAA